MLALGAALVLRLAFFSISVAHLPPSGDESTNVLMGKAIARGERQLLFWGQPYQFPLEAYLLAPTSRVLPRTALGARATFFLVSLVTLGITTAALARLSPWASSWPGLLLVCFPSAYWLTLQAAYFIPQHTAFLFFASLLLWVVVRAQQAPRGRIAFCAAGGFIAGLAWSTHTLILPAAALAGLALCLGRNRRELLTGSAAFIPGLLLGLVPYLVALRRHPGAFKAVSATRDLRRALAALWDPALSSTLPASMGIAPPLFPDFTRRIDDFSFLAKPFALLYLALLVAASWRCLREFVRRLREQRHPSLTLPDVCAGISWGSVLLFALSTRSSAAACRYLLLAVLAFPFLVAFLHGSASAAVRRITASVAIGLAVLNLAASALLMRTWAQPGFAAGVPDTPPLGELISRLEEQGVRHCYASFWQAYRITHDTDERIVCSPPYNERFYAWPLPYLVAVDGAPEPPTYVFTNTHQSRITASRFETELARSGIAHEAETVGPFRIFRSFARQDGLGERPVAQGLQATASHGARDSRLLVDGDPRTSWSSVEPQVAGMWVRLRLPRAVPLASVSVFHGGSAQDQPESLRISVGEPGVPGAFTREVPTWREWVRLESGRLRFGEDQQMLRFPPVVADTVRIEIAGARPGKPWVVREISLGEPAGAP